MDINLYLGYEYFSDIKKLKRGMSGPVEGPAKLHHRVRQKSRTKISWWLQTPPNLIDL